MQPSVPAEVPRTSAASGVAPSGITQSGITQSGITQSGTTLSGITVWRDLLRAQATVLRRLERDLLAEHSLALASYEVLARLGESPDHRLRMTDLAERVLLSRSGLTRLVDRLVREGLVTREVCESAARGLFAVLTGDGDARLRAASVTHRRGIDDYVTGRLDSADLEAMALVLDKLLADQPRLP